MWNEAAPSVTHSAGVVFIGGKPIRMDYAIRDAFWVDSRVIVLLDPNAILADPTYGKDRRRGNDAIRNLRALSGDGAMLWQAELPESADYYYRIENRNPLIVLSFSSYRCEIDQQTGHIIGKQFLK